MKQYIICPKCLLDGRKKTLAELLPDGSLAIERQKSKWSYEDATIISGNTFDVYCGYCRTKVFMRKDQHEHRDQRITWVFGITFAPGTVFQEAYHSPDHPGTALLS